ncbi:MAG: hypothetical protein JJ847_05550 [Prochlorococcus marinus CUG1438]|nr:hypothetical protein [Prochlorococcus marinus CUG1438]
MKRLLLPLLALLSFPTAVNAKLVYLECYFPEQNGREPYIVELTLQEEQGKVTTLFKKTGSTRTYPGTNGEIIHKSSFFSQKILFSQEHNEKTILKWELNRTNGKIFMEWLYDGFSYFGDCKKVKKTKTMF